MNRRTSTRLSLTMLVGACVAGLFQACGGMTEDCPEGLKDCGDVCADVRFDSENCGSCGEKCASNEVCNDKACGIPCGFPEDQRCDGVCVQLSSNLDHCGACHNACAAEQTCFAGECQM
jgi:hypothetical protein